MAQGRPGPPIGHPRYGGRQKGKLNKATEVRAEALAKACGAIGIEPEDLSAITPLDAMLVVMRWALEARNPTAVLAAAMAAAPYIHHKLVQAEVKVTGTVTLSDADLQAEIAQLEAKLAQAGEPVH
jgi:hypothetical protein